VRGVGYCFRRDLPQEVPARVSSSLRQMGPGLPDYMPAAA
jgi:hypothetical protein